MIASGCGARSTRPVPGDGPTDSGPMQGGGSADGGARADAGVEDCADASQSDLEDFSADPRECVLHAENALPYPPLPLYPSGECLCDERPVFLVGNSSDPDGDPLRYHFRVDWDPSFRSLDAQGTSPEGVSPNPVGVTAWQPDLPLLAMGAIYWEAWVDDCFEESEHVITVVRTCF
jgi:hypothetical protein